MGPSMPLPVVGGIWCGVIYVGGVAWDSGHMGRLGTTYTLIHTPQSTPPKQNKKLTRLLVLLEQVQVPDVFLHARQRRRLPALEGHGRLGPRAGVPGGQRRQAQPRDG